MRGSLVTLALVVGCGPAPVATAPAPLATIEPSRGVAAEAPPPLSTTSEAIRACLGDVEGDVASACDARDFDACLRVEWPDASPCALTLATAGCDIHHAPSCNEVARAVVDVDRPRSEALWRDACEAAFAPACTHLGQSLSRDRSDLAEALRLYERACGLGDAEGCAAAGRSYLHGLGTDRDGERGAKLLTRSCEMGHAQGCINLASAHLSGQRQAPDVAKALRLYARACGMDGDPSAGLGCFLWGLQRAQQLGVSPDRAAGEVREAFLRACERGHRDACGLVAVGAYSDQQYEEAIRVATIGVDDAPSWQLFYARGMSRFNLGRHRDALDDFEELARLRPDWHYAELWLWQARERLGRDGDPGLSAALARFPSGWPRPIAEHLLGRIPRAALLRAARDPNARLQLEQECEAFYYVAQRLLAEGHVGQAEVLLHKTVDTGIVDFIEYNGAVAELDLLGKALPAP